MQNLKLGVNIDHVATLRQARGVNYPSVTDAARICVAAGAYGITIHLREDRRHIQDHDLFALRRLLKKAALNLEMANAPEIADIALKAKPDEVCIVPEKRRELTTEGGLDAAGQQRSLKATCRRLSAAGIMVSLFVDPEKKQLDAAAAIGAPCVELHTGAFCNARGAGARKEQKRLIEGARYAHAVGLKVNAGHGITLGNIKSILKMPFLDTLNIGHSIVARAVFVGLQAAVREMLEKMAKYRG
ncbi:MAG: pyridoxine 5'-phosphate synthase [Kiritimatiellae bacterium]|nr:pyridoxine 5'-phosphate synthase [Kiritimatiellia bacterium]